MTSKEFEDKLQLKNFSELEEEFQKTKEYFENLQDKITCEEVSEKFPAFCFLKREIRIKFPTFKVRVIDNQIAYKDLKELLKGLGNFAIYEELNVLRVPSLEPVSSLAIHCLEVGLAANENIAEKIKKKLEENHIISERCVTSGHYCIPIEVDGAGYIFTQK
ncbi:hypothetical protein MKC71_06985 [[Clostridium] innocuum]|nr:hypothetical protein [[Clostridium] innocuum]MCR0559585.1 hypothetical protein [[Clostridium] innocuum]